MCAESQNDYILNWTGIEQIFFAIQDFHGSEDVYGGWSSGL
jgi:hypothetical protein